MEVTANKSKFHEFEIKIKIQSEEEAKALYAIFNRNKNSSLLGYSASTKIKEALGDEYYVNFDEDVIANAITYAEYYGSR